MSTAISYRGTVLWSDSTRGGWSPVDGGTAGPVLEFVNLPRGAGELVKVIGWEGSDVTMELRYLLPSESAVAAKRNELMTMARTVNAGPLYVRGKGTVPLAVLRSVEEVSVERADLGIAANGARTLGWRAVWRLTFRRIR